MDSLDSTYKHWFETSCLIRGNSYLSTLLKSHLLSQCVQVATNRNKLPQTIFGPHVRCSNCCTSWSENKFTIKRKEQLTKSAKRRYKMKIKKHAGVSTDSEITKAYQQLYGKNMIATCHVCSKKTEINLRKDKVLKVKSEKSVKNGVLSRSKLIRVNKKNDTNIILNAKNKIEKPKLNVKEVKENRNSFYLPSNTLSKNEGNKPVEVKPKKKRHKDKYAGLCKLAAVQSKLTSNVIIEKTSNTGLDLLLRRV